MLVSVVAKRTSGRKLSSKGVASKQCLKSKNTSTVQQNLIVKSVENVVSNNYKPLIHQQFRQYGNYPKTVRENPPPSPELRVATNSDTDWYKVDSKFFDDVKNQRKFFDWVGKEKLGIKHLNDWYTITLQQMYQYDPGFFNSKYNNSLYKAVTSIYPEHKWLWNVFDHPQLVSLQYFDNIKTQRDFFDWIAPQLGVKNLDDWYNISQKEFEKKTSLYGGKKFLKVHENQLRNALTAIYPEHEWLPWRFSTTVPAGYWNVEENRKKYFDWLGKKLKFNTLEDWYNIKKEDVAETNGAPMITVYYHNIPAALAKVYPNHDWMPWRFHHLKPKYGTFWHDPVIHKKFLAWTGEKLGVKKLEDWYSKAKVEDFNKWGGEGFMDYFENDIPRVFRTVYPEVEWKYDQFVHHKKQM